MIVRSFFIALASLACGLIIYLVEQWLGSTYVQSFLKVNMLVLIIALLAINTATMGIVLTKLRDITDKFSAGDAFKKPREEMLHTIHEQIGLIIIGASLLTIADSKLFLNLDHFPLLIQSTINGVFVYSLYILYDTSKSVFIISDFDPTKPK